MANTLVALSPESPPQPTKHQHKMGKGGWYWYRTTALTVSALVWIMDSMEYWPSNRGARQVKGTYVLNVYVSTNLTLTWMFQLNLPHLSWGKLYASDLTSWRGNSNIKVDESGDGVTVSQNYSDVTSNEMRYPFYCRESTWPKCWPMFTFTKERFHQHLQN